MIKRGRFRRIVCTTIILSAAFIQCASAREPDRVPKIDAFAFGYPVEITRQAPFQELVLPLELYRNVVSHDLEDCAVFDADQRPVPHAIRSPEPPSRASIAEALPFFPLAGSAESDTGGISVHFKKAPDGTILELKSDDEVRMGGRTVAYVLDASSLKDAYSALVLKVDPDRGSGLIRVNLEGSQNLNDWASIARSVSVGRLVHRGVTLERDRVDFKPCRYKYLRLSWDAGGGELRLVNVQAIFSRQVSRDLHQWLRLPAKLSTAPSPAYLFDTHGVMPVDQLKVQFPGQNVVVPLKVHSRGADGDPWQYRTQALVHRLLVEGSIYSGETIGLPGVVKDRFWKLEVNLRPENGMAPQDVEIAVGWVPHRLVFLAQGRPPYTLAFGSGSQRVRPFPLQSLLDQVAPQTGTRTITASAQPGPKVTLGGESKLQLPPPPLPWKKWALWTCLLLGVALMGWMALRLYRQMGAAQRARPEEGGPTGAEAEKDRR
jgi:hypothetical protein